MSELIYITNTSLDGCVEDQAGAFDWVNPDQVHAFIAELLQPIRTYLYLAEGPEDGLFTNADRRSDTQHACRAGLRLRG
jgi:hypothetical protein